jgi:hypothetical protein
MQTNLSNYNFEVGKEKKFALNLFAKNLVNITSLKVISLSSDVEFTLQGDSLSIKVLKSGQYSYKILGMKGNDVVSISPEYKITNVSTDIEPIASTISDKYQLFQNYPNPFNPTTVIRYQISDFSHVILKVYDVLGRVVATLVDEYKEPGYYNVEFKLNSDGYTSGVYFYQLKSGSFIETRKMILIK